MEMTFFLPLFLTSSSLIVFWLIYQLFLAKLTHFTLQRGYLLSSILFSCCLPFIPRFTNWWPSISANDALTSAILVNPLTLDLTTETSTKLETIGSMSPTIDFMALFGGLLVIIYLTGIILKTLFFVDKLSALHQLISSNPKEKEGKQWFIKLSESGTAFSFFNYVFFTKSIDNLNPSEVAQIKAHEQIHCQQKHSFDIILVEIAEICLWFLPVIYWMKNNLKDLHEYLVDEVMIQEKVTKRSYAELLMKLSSPLSVNSLTTGFTNKQIGRRINMLAKKPSATYHKLKFLLMIPIIASLLLFSACFGEESLSPKSELEQAVIRDQEQKLSKDILYTVEELNWEGSKAFTEEELSKALNIKVGDKIHSSVRDYRLENIEKNKAYLKDLYHRKGFILEDVKIELIGFRDSSLSLTISITEQKEAALKVGKISWEGNTIFTDKELNEAFQLKAGDVFNQELLEERLYWDGKGTDVSSLYFNKGYAYFRVEVVKMHNGSYIIDELPKGDYVIDFNFKVFEGMDVSIADINFSGNETISTADLMSKIDMKVGDAFSRSKIIAAQKTLAEMGKFDPKKIGISTPILAENNQLMNIEFSLVEIEK